MRYNDQHQDCQIINRKFVTELFFFRSGLVSLLISIFKSYSIMAPSQCSGQSNNSCGGHSNGYSAWMPNPGQQQFIENFYNNPIQYPSSYSIVPHQYQTAAPNQQQTKYTQQPPNSRNGHPHCPPNHTHSADYQLFQPYNRKCNNAR